MQYQVFTLCSKADIEVCLVYCIVPNPKKYNEKEAKNKKTV